MQTLKKDSTWRCLDCSIVGIDLGVRSSMFANDYLDGTLEQLTLAPQSLSIMVFAKMIAHWLLTGLPLVLIAPLVGLFYHLPMNTIGVMMLSAITWHTCIKHDWCNRRSTDFRLAWRRCFSVFVGATFVYSRIGIWLRARFRLVWLKV